MKTKNTYVYAICYIEQTSFHKLNHELQTRGYKNLTAFVPIVKLVEKTRKGQIQYKEVPLLFSYGFIRMPRKMAYDRHALIKLKKAIPSIRSFLRSNENLFKKKKKRRIDNAEDWDDFSKVALCPIRDVKRFKRLSDNNKIFSLEDMFNIRIGDFLILHTYPYIGIEAEVVEVNYMKKTVKLNMYPAMGFMELTLPLEEVLYSVYKNCNPDKSIIKAADWNDNLKNHNKNDDYSSTESMGVLD